VTPSTRLIYLVNPNNPTGMALNADDLRSFCQTVSKQATVLVDEAYNELTDNPAKETMMDLVRNNENVMVSRTFSKVFGLAGMRVGYTMAPASLAQRLKQTVMSWPNSIGVAAAVASFKDAEFLEFSRKKIAQGRKIAIDAFRQRGIDPLPSKTNFVYADIKQDANQFARRMRDQGVHIASAYSGYPNYSRVSMGRLEDLERFAEVLRKVI
ncbi:MAG: histidinol-phosphate transaminase, partial [Pseudomonadota bacterium]